LHKLKNEHARFIEVQRLVSYILTEVDPTKAVKTDYPARTDFRLYWTGL